MEYMGADEQGEALPFVRLFSPTDLQETGWKMGEIIASHHSWDWVNPTMWRIVGLESGNIMEFLKRYILIARQWQVPLNSVTMEKYRNYFISEYDYRSEDLDEIFDAFFQTRDAGFMPDTIYMPWTYEQTTLAEDIGEAAGKAVSSAVPKIALVALLGVAAYAFFSTGLPRLAARSTS